MTRLSAVDRNSRSFLFTFVALMLLPGVLAPREFFIEDEARFAEILRELIYEGEWLVLHLNGYTYPDKPPLYFWLAALPAKLFGRISVLSFMLVTWVTSIATAAATHRMARRFYGRRSARYGTLALSAMLLFLIGSDLVHTDMLTCCFFVLAVDSFHRRLLDSQRGPFWGFWFFTGLAMMTKGLSGLFLPVLTAILFLFWDGRRQELRRLFFSPGLLLPLLMMAGWFASAWFCGYGNLAQHIWMDRIAAMSPSRANNGFPTYYFLFFLPLILLPWTPFLPRACVTVFKRDPSRFRLLASWFLIGLLFISFHMDQSLIFALPLLPPVAITLGLQARDLFAKRGESQGYFQLEALLVTGGFFGVLGLAPLMLSDPRLVKLPLNTLIIFGMVCTLIGVFLVLSNHRRSFFAAVVLAMAFFNGYLTLGIAPSVNEKLSPRQVGEHILQLQREGYLVSLYETRRGIFSFYAGQRLPELQKDDLPTYLARSEMNVVLCKEQNRDKLEAALAPNQVLRNLGEIELSLVNYLMLRRVDVR